MGNSSDRAKLGVTYAWDVCNDYLNGRWASSDYFADTTKLYSEIYNHPNKPADFKMLVYSGDSDGVCATIGTQHWIYDIDGAKLITLHEPWQYVDSFYGTQQAGFITKFSNMLTFATVQFAGHEVPAYQPERALKLFQMYLDGSIFSSDTSKTNKDDNGSSASSSTSSSSTSSTSSSSNKSSGNNVLSIVIAVLLVVVAVGVMAIYYRPRKRPMTLQADSNHGGLDQSNHLPLG